MTEDMEAGAPEVLYDEDERPGGNLFEAARPSRFYQNAGPARLVTMALERGEGELSAAGALVVRTGAFTGRSPKDKFLVDHPRLSGVIDWNDHNQAIGPEGFRQLRERALWHVQGRELFVQELIAGADPQHRLKVRVLTERAWHALFARNMFIRPERSALRAFEPDWMVLQLPSLEARPEEEGTRSSTAIMVDPASRTVLIVGTAYAGEIKKSIFGVMNHLLPERGVLPMHCSANVGPKGDVALFFGLSGTGKTTLSADPARALVGDDEHGWSDDGIFNFEGGCYAKVVNLDPQAEPEIWSASNRFGAILENVLLDPVTAEPDFADTTLTENTRSSYPLSFIPNAVPDGRAGHPSNIFMLTCDAFGVLPPISLLTPEQAMVQFLSGYTAKVAGTERDLKEPQATFSACFGAPFMPRHPTVYAELLRDKMKRHGTRCWLVNTGWSGGSYGEGRRMDLATTRALLHAALSGELAGVEMRAERHFGLHFPTVAPGVDASVLDPREAWEDQAAYDAKASEVASMFEQNAQAFIGHLDVRARQAVPHAA